MQGNNPASPYALDTAVYELLPSMNTCGSFFTRSSLFALEGTASLRGSKDCGMEDKRGKAAGVAARRGFAHISSSGVVRVLHDSEQNPSLPGPAPCICINFDGHLMSWVGSRAKFFHAKSWRTLMLKAFLIQGHGTWQPKPPRRGGGVGRNTEYPAHGLIRRRNIYDMVGDVSVVGPVDESFLPS